MFTVQIWRDGAGGKMTKVSLEVDLGRFDMVRVGEQLIYK